MNNSLYAAYEQAINALPFSRRLAFACACAEHVLPFFEKKQSSTIPRVALNKLWKLVEGESMMDSEIVEFIERLNAVVPSIDDDEVYCLERDIIMKSAVTVLECLDLAGGKDDAVMNVGNLVFDILMLVELRRAPEQVFKYEVFYSLEKDEPLPTSVREEWMCVRNLLEKLNQEVWSTCELFRAEHQARGVCLALLF